jgi:hypothetical protein
MFLKNEQKRVKNGTLGTLEAVSKSGMSAEAMTGSR